MKSRSDALASAANLWLDRQISGFANLKTARPGTVRPVRYILDGIQSGVWADSVAKVRLTLKKQGDAAYKAARADLLRAYTISGTFSNRSNEDLLVHSGLLCLDLDDLGERLDVAREALRNDPHVMAFFTSPSGHGLKVIVGTAATDKDTHRAAFVAARDHFAAKGLEADESCKDVSRLCLVSHDPAMYRSSSSSFLLFTGAEATPDTYTATTTTPTPTLHHEGEGGGKGAAIAARIARQNDLRAKDPALIELYDKIVAPNFTPEPNKRNEALTAIVPFLFRALGPDKAKKAASAMLEINSDVYTGSKDEHLASLESLWEGCEGTYKAELTTDETAVYDALEDRRKAVFRILRDFAKRGGGQFYMAGDELQRRVGVGCNGWRDLKYFCGLGLIKETKAGQKRLKDVPGKAAYYQWLLSDLSGQAVKGVA